MSRFIRLMFGAWSPTRRGRECCLPTGMPLFRTALPVLFLSPLPPGSIRNLQSSWRSSRCEAAEAAEQAAVEQAAPVGLAAAAPPEAAPEPAVPVAKAVPRAPEVKVAAALPPP